jgi:hypothetical protein
MLPDHKDGMEARDALCAVTKAERRSADLKGLSTRAITVCLAYGFLNKPLVRAGLLEGRLHWSPAAKFWTRNVGRDTYAELHKWAGLLKPCSSKNHPVTCACRPDSTLLLKALDGLVKECEYSASSGLPFNSPEGKGHWTQLHKAKDLLAVFRPA